MHHMKLRHPERRRHTRGSHHFIPSIAPFEHDETSSGLQEWDRPSEQAVKGCHRTCRDHINPDPCRVSAHVLSSTPANHHSAVEPKFFDNLLQERRPTQEWFDQGERQIGAGDSPYQAGEASSRPHVRNSPRTLDKTRVWRNHHRTVENMARPQPRRLPWPDEAKGYPIGLEQLSIRMQLISR